MRIKKSDLVLMNVAWKSYIIQAALRERSAKSSPLGSIGPSAQSATSQLISLLESPDLRNNVSAALRRIGITKEHVPALIKLLKQKDIRTRQLAAINLAQVGSDAEPASDLLIAMLGEQQQREFAIFALGQIRSKSAVPHLIKLLSDESYYIRAGAAEALGQFGPNAKQAIPLLEKASKDEHPLTRKHAKKALQRIK